MNKRKLGRTDLHVSEFCLNAAEFAWHNNEATSLALLDSYAACGGGFIQAAGSCARPSAASADDDHSEEIVGRWHRMRGVDRDNLVLATRTTLFHPAHGGSIAFANRLREACERSLRRLQTRHLDLLICDWADHLVPLEDVLEAVDLLIRAGLVRHVVADGLPSWRVVDSIHRSAARNRSRFEAIQAGYSPVARSGSEPETFAMCRMHRIGFLARSPSTEASFARRSRLTCEEAGPCRYRLGESFDNRPDDFGPMLLSEIAESRAASPDQVVLAWILRNPQVSAAVVSAASARELNDLLRAGTLRLSDRETCALENARWTPDLRTEFGRA